ncbi:hypothetical protein HS088_TW08G00189 [Tripterygium wilfordii]|uniref:Uncharacterized protein n=1 Tax=Tripterygium wilfordii TaxID=458696 RepID=A0A7J7DBE1_TRIWF|nr:hypothetical protein HS088_TW08G00189 [Tripterygium wilfordii]
MARGVTSCDEAGATAAGGNVSSSTALFEPTSDFRESSKSYMDYDVGDVFFGTDDLADTRDFLYKEDVIESYRRDRALKLVKRRDKRSSSIAECFEFLKLILCIR